MSRALSVADDDLVLVIGDADLAAAAAVRGVAVSGGSSPLRTGTG